MNCIKQKTKNTAPIHQKQNQIQSIKKRRNFNSHNHITFKPQDKETKNTAQIHQIQAKNDYTKFGSSPKQAKVITFSSDYKAVMESLRRAKKR